MSTMNKDVRELHDTMVREFAERGGLLAAGFEAMRLTVIPPDASAVQISEMRLAYMAGAQHLYASLMVVFDPGSSEPTEADLHKMAMIAAELDAFADEMKLRVVPTGRAQ